MPISPQEQKYLKNKHKGGNNNSKGNLYENFYATYCIALFMNRHILQLDRIHFTSQLSNHFVDDLFIEDLNTTHRMYHQIKDVKDLSWKTPKLASDFGRQMEISNERKENFELILVHSNSSTKLKSIPDKFSSCTSISFFPASQSLNQLILSYPPFKDAIQNITISGTAEDDELLGIAEVLLGVWVSKIQKDLSLKEISDEIKNIGKGYINIKTYPNVDISNKCKDIFKYFNLSFHTCGMNLHWEANNGKLTGRIEWTPAIEQKLENTIPSDFWELIELLS